MRVVIKQDFVKLKAGDVVEVRENPNNPNVYIVDGAGGNAFYLPKLITEVTEDTPATPPHSHQFSGDDTVVPPVSPEGSSEEELAVLRRLSKGLKPDAPANDGPTGTPFSGGVVFHKTAADKLREAEGIRLREIREKLNFTGEPLLCEGELWLTDLTEGELPDSGVNYKITTYTMTRWDRQNGKWVQTLNQDYPWFNSMAITDIPDINWAYMWDANVLESIVIADKLNERLLLTGPPGTGKTTALRQYAAWVNQPSLRFNGKDGIEQGAFLGTNTVRDGSMIWEDGYLPIGLKGNYLIILDEVFKIPPGVQMALQPLYEKGGFLMLDEKPGNLFDKTVIPGPHCRIFTTDNVKGTGDASELFAATQIQDTSTLDRFGITQNVKYLPESKEVKMLGRIYGLDKDTLGKITRLVKFANQVREGYINGKIALTMSPRGLLTTMEQITKLGVPEKDALKLSFINKIADDTELQTIDQAIKSIW